MANLCFPFPTIFTYHVVSVGFVMDKALAAYFTPLANRFQVHRLDVLRQIALLLHPHRTVRAAVGSFLLVDQYMARYMVHEYAAPVAQV